MMQIPQSQQDLRMLDTFNLITVVDGQRDSASILEILQQIKNGTLPNDLRLLNYYKEIPVSYEAEISHIDDDLVELQVHQHQAVVMSLEKITFIKSRHFPHDVVAKVYKASINKSLALLTRFSYGQVRAERRRFVRVQVHDKIPVNFSDSEQSVNGMLLDISIGGLSITSSERCEIPPDTFVTLQLNLSNTAISPQGKLLKTVPSDDRWRYFFELESDHKIESAISQFIFHKQVEIIRELKDQLLM
jgi:hypothetical protein